jgi:hypothetical protein
MAICANCGRERPNTTVVTYWTGRETRRFDWLGSAERHQDSSFTDFSSHSYEVCSGCQKFSRWLPFLAPGIVILLTLLVLLAVNPSAEETATLAWILAVGAALAIAAAVLSPGLWRPPRLAVAERKRADPKGHFKAFKPQQQPTTGPASGGRA